MSPICAPRILRRHSGPTPCRSSTARIINFSSVMSTSERSGSLAGCGMVEHPSAASPPPPNRSGSGRLTPNRPPQKRLRCPQRRKSHTSQQIGPAQLECFDFKPAMATLHRGLAFGCSLSRGAANARVFADDHCDDGVAGSDAGSCPGRDLAAQSGVGGFQYRRQLDPGHGADRHRLLRRVEHHSAVVPGRHCHGRRLDVQRRRLGLHLRAPPPTRPSASTAPASSSTAAAPPSANSVRAIFHNTSTAGSATITNGSATLFSATPARPAAPPSPAR